MEHIEGWRVTIATGQHRVVKTHIGDAGSVDVLPDAIYEALDASVESDFLKLEVVARVAAFFLQEELDDEMRDEFCQFIDAADKLVVAIDKWRGRGK